MKSYKTIEITTKDQVATIWLNRPEIRNAFNETMISELIDAFGFLDNDNEIRIVVLRGRGKAFCAGADLNWMKNVKDYTYEQNYNESYNLSKCFYAIYTSKKVTIAIVHGAAIGGANGLLAACDFAYGEEITTFSLSEVKIGVIPACISPYVIKRVGEYPAKELMLTGKRINGPEAEKFGLINKSFAESELENHVNETIHFISRTRSRFTM
jgi:methylglutaconyl-CoA hydratase